MQDGSCVVHGVVYVTMHCPPHAVYALMHVNDTTPDAGQLSDLQQFDMVMVTLAPASEAHSLDLPPHYVEPPLSCSRVTL